jgi:inosine/xanthosine triphosphatase
VRNVIIPHFPFPLELVHTRIDSGVAAQPRSLSETIRGAKTRACKALLEYNGTFGIGIESGIVELPGSRSLAMELAVCAIFNGKHYALGQSAGFEIPTRIMGDIVTHEHTLTEGFPSVGFIDGEHDHDESSILSALTHGMMNRQMQNEQALVMALIQLDHPELYGYRD